MTTNNWDVSLYAENPAGSNQLFINVTSVVIVKVSSIQLVDDKVFI